VNCAMSIVALVLLGMPLRASAQNQGGGMPLRPNTQNQGGVEITSANVPQDMILPRDQFKAIHFYQSGEFFSKFPDPKSTPSGLYLLDSEFVPKQLPAILAKNNVALGPEGTVINQKGEKVVLVLGYRMVAVNEHADVGGIKPPSWPYPLEYVSWWWTFNDNEGFCRSFTQTTGADAWGPIIDQWGDRAHTNIDYMEAVADASNVHVDHWGYGISWQYSQAYKDFGCWWPAHDGYHAGWVYFQDGGWHWFANW
jgi:hypothetical protein